jgi:hypothetical protein
MIDARSHHGWRHNRPGSSLDDAFRVLPFRRVRTAAARHRPPAASNPNRGKSPCRIISSAAVCDRAPMVSRAGRHFVAQMCTFKAPPGPASRCTFARAGPSATEGRRGRKARSPSSTRLSGTAPRSIDRSIDRSHELGDGSYAGQRRESTTVELVSFLQLKSQ